MCDIDDIVAVYMFLGSSFIHAQYVIKFHEIFNRNNAKILTKVTFQ